MEYISRLVIFPNGIPKTAEVLAELESIDGTEILTITDEKSIKIEQIRELQAQLATASQFPQGRVVLITPAEKITPPAQQALLKLVEEPPANTRVVFVASSRQALLPTLQSRCQISIIQQKKEEASEEGLWEQLQTSKSLRERVVLTQQLPNKREELEPLLLNELRRLQSQPVSSESIEFREHLVTSLEALKSNVSPALVIEKLLL